MKSYTVGPLLVRGDPAVKTSFIKGVHGQLIFLKLQTISEKLLLLRLYHQRVYFMVTYSFKDIFSNLSKSYPEVIIKLSDMT